jgi:hypothetical protein
MKVQLSEIETYELKTPKRILTKGEFSIFVEKMNKIAKAIGRDEISDSINNIKVNGKSNIKEGRQKKARYPMSIITHDRKLAVSLVKDYYLGSEIDLKYLAKRLGENGISGKIYYLKNKLKIKPQEVGLKEYPNLHNFNKFKEDKDKWKLKAK